MCQIVVMTDIEDADRRTVLLSEHVDPRLETGLASRLNASNRRRMQAPRLGACGDT